MARAGTAERETSVERNIRFVVKALLASRDMTGAQFAGEFGLSQQQTYDRLNGTKPFTADEVARLAGYFRLPVQVFFDGPEALFGTPSRRPISVGSDGDNGI